MIQIFSKNVSDPDSLKNVFRMHQNPFVRLADSMDFSFSNIYVFNKKNLLMRICLKIQNSLCTKEQLKYNKF